MVHPAFRVDDILEFGRLDVDSSLNQPWGLYGFLQFICSYSSFKFWVKMHVSSAQICLYSFRQSSDSAKL